MRRVFEILNLVERPPAYWAEVRAWLPPEIVLSDPAAEFSGPDIPFVILGEPSGVASAKALGSAPRSAGLATNADPPAPPHLLAESFITAPEAQANPHWGWIEQGIAQAVRLVPADSLVAERGSLLGLQPLTPQAWQLWSGQCGQWLAPDDWAEMRWSGVRELLLPADCSPRELALGLVMAVDRMVLQRLGAVEVQRAQQRLTRWAYRDSLTGLPNRRAWRHFWRHAGDSSAEEPSLCVALLDLDLFKQLNTNFGHATADRVLRRVGQTLRRELRSNDFAARLGGDEFGIVLNPLPPGATVDVLQRLRRVVREQLIASRLPSLTASIGYTTMPLGRHDSPRRAFHRAAEALRRGKREQRNAVWGFDPRWPAHCDSSSDDD